MAEEDKDKSEQATPFKLEEARKRGQVARSVDLVSFFMVGALLIGINGWAGGLPEAGWRLTSHVLGSDPRVLSTPASAAAWFGPLVGTALGMMMPFLALAVIAAILGNAVQSSPSLTGFPLKPDLQRINPASGFKRLFSLRTLYDGTKTLVKFVTLAVVGYLAIEAVLPKLVVVQQASPRGYVPLLFEEIRSVLFKLLILLCAIGLIDFAYNRWDFAKRMMMSRREVRDEVKRREGDPAVRARMRELQRELLQRAKSMQRIPEADVLITNPEHYAVALKYDRQSMPAPCVIAKGAGLLAQEMKLAARRARVPLVEDRKVAKRLFAVAELGQSVPGELFEPLARIYVALRSEEHAAGILELRG